MGLPLKDIEGTHKLLYEAHWAVMKAKDKVHAAIVAIHAAGMYATDRQKSKEPLAELERARDLLDQALEVAGNGRSKLINVTGCDGSCSP